jgi:hypothetical protein
VGDGPAPTDGERSVPGPEADVRSPLGVLVAVALVGCSSMGGLDDSYQRRYRGGDLAAVVAGVLDALPAAGVQLVDARRGAEGQGVIVRGRASVRGPQPFTLVLEVVVAETAEAVRVKVSAEPPDRGAAAAEGPLRAVEEATQRSCACNDPPFPLDPRPRDNLRVLAESRKLARAYLAVLDARLRQIVSPQ